MQDTLRIPAAPSATASPGFLLRTGGTWTQYRPASVRIGSRSCQDSVRILTEQFSDQANVAFRFFVVDEWNGRITWPKNRLLGS
jgi:hypothetical protein